MVIIAGGGPFDGAIVPDNNELKATIHALVVERDRVAGGHGDHYGEMTIRDLDSYIAQLQQYQRERGA